MKLYGLSRASNLLSTQSGGGGWVSWTIDLQCNFRGSTCIA